MRHRLPADVLLLATVVFWSFNFTVVKYALTHGWEPLAYSSVRFAIGALLFSGFTYAREGSLVVRRTDVLLMTGAAAAGIWLNQLSFAYAVKLTTAATVALMFGTLPIFVALIAWVAAADLVTIALLALAMLGMQFAIGATNDIVDQDLDAQAKPWKPIPCGLVSQRAAAAIAVATGVTGFVLAVLAGAIEALLWSGMLACGLAYDLRLKPTPWAWA